MTDVIQPESIKLIGCRQAPSGSTQRQRVELTLHTALARRVFKGQTDGPVGIPQFAAAVKEIWEACRNDDPYADLFLLRIYDAIVKTRRRFQAREAEYSQKLQRERRVSSETLVNDVPSQIPLALATPYSFMAVYLLVDFDVLVALFVTLRQLALMPEKETFQQVRLAAYEMRLVFSTVMPWHNTGVTRADIREGTEKGLLAKKLMGELDERIFFEEIELPYSPKSVRKSLASTTEK